MGGDPRPSRPHFSAAFRNVDPIDDAAHGHGFINAGRRAPVVRHMSLAATVGEAIVPALGVEMLRVASGAGALGIRTGPRGVQSVVIGDLAIPTEPDGSVRIHFAPSDGSRFVSAGDVLSGRADPRQFERKLVLVGVTATGLGDRHETPVASSVPGVEIHAQLLECIFDGDLLTRPSGIDSVEVLLVLLAGVGAFFVVKSASVAVSMLSTAAMVLALLGLPSSTGWAAGSCSTRPSRSS